jgi:acetyl-CoA carboxylase carboxyl transferase subunit beta
MGVAAGERICRAFEHASGIGVPVIALTASGGARMQEGMLALSQMPATLSAREKLARAHRPFICYLRNPTTGGVFASFANSADVLWAEPRATIGFAGPRVAETVTGEPLPEGSHTAESAYDAALVDEIVPDDELAARLREIFRQRQFAHAPMRRDVDEPVAPAGLDAWSEVGLARHERRPSGWDYVPGGTRLRRGVLDPTILVSIQREGFAPTKMPLFIAQDRSAGHGRTTVSGYRAIRRAIATAVRLDIPIVTVVDTPGADPSSRSEEEGIAAEISATFEALLEAPVPTLSIVVGEGGSGGALALAVCDVVMIQQHAIFSVIAPEGAASILRREDPSGVAGDLRLTSFDLRRLGLADAVIPEPGDGAHTDSEGAIGIVRWAALGALERLMANEPGGNARVFPTARRSERWRVFR